MAVVDVLDNIGSKISRVDLNDMIFSVSINKGLIHQVVVAQLGGRRAGTVGVKGRSDIVGSGRKLYRQKGTGRARKGNIKSPLLRGGGVVFGPMARSYAKKVPKKVKRSALKMAVSSKFRDNQLIVINDFGLTTAKTRAFVDIVKNIKAPNSLIVTDGNDNFLSLSSRSVPGIKVLNYKGLNVVDVLKYSKLVVLEASLKSIEGKLA